MASMLNQGTLIHVVATTLVTGDGFGREVSAWPDASAKGCRRRGLARSLTAPLTLAAASDRRRDEGDNGWRSPAAYLLLLSAPIDRLEFCR